MENNQPNYFFVDIDGTITDNNPGKRYPEEKLVWRNPIFGVIRDVMAEEGYRPEEAKKKIEEYADKIIWWDYPDFVAEFNLPLEKTWERIYRWHKEYLSVYQDTVDLIKKLHGKKKNLFVVSNNPVVGCLLKLKRAGLGDITGTPYFKRILGANILRGQKSQKELWKRAIAHIGIPPEKIAIVGDNLTEDAKIPFTTGIKKAFIILRGDVNDNLIKDKRIIAVKSATDIIPLCT